MQHVQLIKEPSYSCHAIMLYVVARLIEPNTQPGLDCLENFKFPNFFHWI